MYRPSDDLGHYEDKFLRSMSGPSNQDDVSAGRSANGILGSFGLVQMLLDPSDLKFGEMIAKGSSGQVFDAFYAGSPCVAKRMKKNLLLLEKEQITEMAREVSLLAGLRHPNIVTFFGEI
jgi:hypothetical protein